MGTLLKSFFTNNFLLLVVLLNILNSFDAGLTIYWVTNDIAEEANPLMEILLDSSPWLFASVKITLVMLGSFLLYRHKDSRVSWGAISCCLLVYLWLMSVHHQVYSDNLSFLSHIVL